MNLPNQLTMGRLFLTALFVAVMSIPDQLLKSIHLLDYRITIAILFFFDRITHRFFRRIHCKKVKIGH